MPEWSLMGFIAWQNIAFIYAFSNFLLILNVQEWRHSSYPGVIITLMTALGAPGINICQHVYISNTFLLCLHPPNIWWKGGGWTSKECWRTRNTSQNTIQYSSWQWTSQNNPWSRVSEFNASVFCLEKCTLKILMFFSPLWRVLM